MTDFHQVMIHSVVVVPPSGPHLVVSPSLFVDDEWIKVGTDRMLWLPPDYRPSCSDVHGNVVSLGHRSGRVSIFHFTF